MNKAIADWNTILQIAGQLTQNLVSQEAALRQIGWPAVAPQIIAAHYGGADITTLARMLFVRSNSIVINTAGGIPIKDPVYGVHKALSLVYRFDQDENSDSDEDVYVFVGNGDAGFSWTLSMSTPPKTSKTGQLNDAEIGVAPKIPPPEGSGSGSGSGVHIWAVFHGQRHVLDPDVYRKLYLCARENTDVVVSATFFNGTGAADALRWPGEPKSAAVVYTVNGAWRSMCGKAGDVLRWQM